MKKLSDIYLVWYYGVVWFYSVVSWILTWLKIPVSGAHLDSGRRPISYQLIGAPPPLPPLLLLFTAPPLPPPHSPVGMTQLVNRFLYPATPARRDPVVQLCGICCLSGIIYIF